MIKIGAKLVQIPACKTKKCDKSNVFSKINVFTINKQYNRFYTIYIECQYLFSKIRLLINFKFCAVDYIL